ncbi:MAG: hypothetical protein QXU32_00930 [Nitrososphaerales archaeon]
MEAIGRNMEIDPLECTGTMVGNGYVDTGAMEFLLATAKHY